MIRRNVRMLIVLALLVGAPEAGQAQQTIDRFPATTSFELSQPSLQIESSRSTYWLEGALLGVAVGVVAALTTIDTQGTCTTGVPGHCETTYVPRIIGGVLMGIGGGFLGGMLGASIQRASDHGG